MFRCILLCLVYLSQQQKNEHGEVSSPLNFPELGASVHSAIKACRSVMWIGSWVWCCGNQKEYKSQHSLDRLTIKSTKPNE